MIETPVMKAASRMNIEDVYDAVLELLKEQALHVMGLLPHSVVLHMTWRAGESPELPEIDTFQGQFIYGDDVAEPVSEVPIDISAAPSTRSFWAYAAPATGLGVGLIASIAAVVGKEKP